MLINILILRTLKTIGIKNRELKTEQQMHVEYKT